MTRLLPDSEQSPFLVFAQIDKLFYLMNLILYFTILYIYRFICIFCICWSLTLLHVVEVLCFDCNSVLHFLNHPRKLCTHRQRNFLHVRPMTNPSSKAGQENTLVESKQNIQNLVGGKHSPACSIHCVFSTVFGF